MTYLSHPANYDKFPSIGLNGPQHQVHADWPAVLQALSGAIEQRGVSTLALDCYPGVDKAALRQQLSADPQFAQALWLDIDDCYVQGEALESRLAETLTDDRVFGVMSHAVLSDYLRPAALQALKQQQSAGRLTIIIGTGAALAQLHDLLVYIDYPRWQRQLALRGGASNWLTENPDEDFLKKYKRGFFWEWRIADRHKRSLFAELDFYLDIINQPVALIDGKTFNAALDRCLATPFRLDPFFDPGVWGGKWMEEVCQLPANSKNYAWCFDGVPEENSLTLKINGVRLSMPAINLVLARPTALLGPQVYARFGAEFPIRFDFLDTMQGGNLSLQVHPLTDYIQQKFGMQYTQDESYYLLDAREGASVYLGLKTGVSSEQLFDAIEEAQQTGQFDDQKYVNCFPVKKHDHVLIPSGTVHCSGSNAMILEISATPYIFTFKLWDWGRLGLDNKPRPIHLDHGKQAVQQERDTQWCQQQLLNRVVVKEENADYTCERTGLHELEFIETHRYWIRSAVTIETLQGFQMLNLVEGQEALVECPDNSFPACRLNYAETLVIPAAVQRYRVSVVKGAPIGIIVANVRRQESLP